MASQDGPRRAADMQHKDIQEELRRRGYTPTNFLTDDAPMLQRLFDEEWEAQREQRERAAAAAREAKRQREETEKRRRELERKRAEEHHAVETDPQARFWIALTRDNATPRDVVLRLGTPIGVRAWAKSLRSNHSIRTLDIRRCDLRDDVGRELAAALAENTSLLKLELEGNHFTSATAYRLGDALRTNSTLRTLLLDDNPLTAAGREYDGLEHLVESLRENRSLTCLGLSGTHLGARGGELLGSLFDSNRTLLRLTVSPLDGVSVQDMASVQSALRANQEAVRARQREEKEERAEQRRRRAEADAAAAKDAEEEARRAWIERLEESRQRLREETEREQIHQEEQQRQERELQEMRFLAMLQEEKAKAAKKKSKKKK